MDGKAISKQEATRLLLGKCAYSMAPMIDQSELAFRMLCRSYTPDLLCYTPMLLSTSYVSDPEYRRTEFTTCAKDRPLVAQISGHDPNIMLEAARLLQPQCDAIDINLGCPLKHAKENLYGSYLLDKTHWDLVRSIVSTLSSNLEVPVFCKIRLLSTTSETVQFAKILEESGCQLIAVHGRTRLNQHRKRAGPADWEAIKAVKNAVNIPVIANGNIQRFSDVEKCMQYTQCDGVMSAEALLENPLLFTGTVPNKYEIIEEYLAFATQYGALFAHQRDHIKNILRKSLEHHPDIYAAIKAATSIEKVREEMTRLQDREKEGTTYGQARKALKQNDITDETLFQDALQLYGDD